MSATAYGAAVAGTVGHRPLTVCDEIALERRRQIEAEGFTAGQDDGYQDGELARAAAAYAVSQAGRTGAKIWLATGWAPLWPWVAAWWKPKTRRDDLVRAGALIVAEIERLDRQAAKA